MKKLILISFFLCGCAFRDRINKPALMYVSVPVADVRAEPQPRENNFDHDPLQETQVLKGEKVLVLERKNGWARVQCLQQMEFSHKSKWEGYPGWIQEEYLSADSDLSNNIPRLTTQNKNNLREKILMDARRHLGTLYLWGGRSYHNSNDKDGVTGVDCSGLVNLSFWSVGWEVPRDAHEQYLKALPVEPSQLKPADLVFLANKTNPKKIVHVAFYVGDNRILEAIQTGEKAREISFYERFGKNLAELKIGDEVGDRIIYFGTFF